MMPIDSKALTVIEQPGGAVEEHRRPQAIIAQATEQATVLMNVVNDKNLFAVINGRKHLTAEAWEIIAAFNNAHAVPRFVEPIKDGETTIGYRAQVDIFQHGEVVSSGIMSCGFEEYPCRGKEGMAKHRAAESAAQTWALAKAARMKFAWVAVLAGYAPTPAEEMSGEETKQSTDNPNWCREHKTVWFKKGKMTGFGHPIEGTEPKEWCHMPSQPKPAPRQVYTATGEVTDPPEDRRPLVDQQSTTDGAAMSTGATTTAPSAKRETTSADLEGQLAYYDGLLVQVKAANPGEYELRPYQRKNATTVAGAIVNLESKLTPKEEAQ